MSEYGAFQREAQLIEVRRAMVEKLLDVTTSDVDAVVRGAEKIMRFITAGTASAAPGDQPGAESSPGV